VSFPRGQYENLKASMEVSNSSVAPVMKGDKLGEIKVNFNNQIIAKQDLVALNTVEKGGLFKRLFDEIAMKIKQ
jgi:D-alanyl-D-alanine carboxypeptidase (penicillin-binding protein 5/6)